MLNNGKNAKNNKNAKNAKFIDRSAGPKEFCFIGKLLFFGCSKNSTVCLRSFLKSRAHNRVSPIGEPLAKFLLFLLFQKLKKPRENSNFFSGCSQRACFLAVFEHPKRKRHKTSTEQAFFEHPVKK